MDVQVDRATSTLYARLEERVMARDQIGASQVYYDLVRAGRPLKEIVAEGVRIHAPYTHVPYHERIDDGYPELRQQRPLPAERARHGQPVEDGAGAAGDAADGADHLVHPERARYLEPEDRQGARHYTRARGNLGAIEKPPEPGCTGRTRSRYARKAR